jgi:hypothetical protein
MDFKLKFCPKCGFVFDYNLAKIQKKTQNCCIYCLFTEAEKIRFKEVIITEKDDIFCRICGKKWGIEEKEPKFFNILDRTYYCGCQDIENILSMDSQTDNHVILKRFIKYFQKEEL